MKMQLLFQLLNNLLVSKRQRAGLRFPVLEINPKLVKESQFFIINLEIDPPDQALDNDILMDILHHLREFAFGLWLIYNGFVQWLDLAVGLEEALLDFWVKGVILRIESHFQHVNDLFEELLVGVEFVFVDDFVKLVLILKKACLMKNQRMIEVFPIEDFEALLVTLLQLLERTQGFSQLVVGRLNLGVEEFY